MQLIQRNRSRSPQAATARGFTLIEVLVAVIITAIGLLGLAKIQALAYASTGTASARSLVAIQAAGLAAVMHANRAYWATGSAPYAGNAGFTITRTSSGGTLISDTTLNTTSTGATDCMLGGSGTVPCGAAALAAFDLHIWANALNNLMPAANPVTTITCPTGSTPINCTIVITWNEKSVALNAQAAAATTTATFVPTYTLYVQP